MGRMAAILLVVSAICTLAAGQKVETLKIGEATVRIVRDRSVSPTFTPQAFTESSTAAATLKPKTDWHKWNFIGEPQRANWRKLWAKAL